MASNNRNSNNAPAKWTQNTIAPDAPMTFIGNLGKDPEQDQTKGGTDVAKFSLATERYDFQEKKSVTVWMQVQVFGAQVQSIMKYLHKGSTVQITTEGIQAYINLANNEPEIQFSCAARHVKYVNNFGDGSGSNDGNGNGRRHDTGNGKDNHDENGYGDNSKYETSDVPGWNGDQLSDIPF